MGSILGPRAQNGVSAVTEKGDLGRQSLHWRSSMRTTGLVVLAAGLMLAAGCGGDNSGSSVNTSATTSVASGTAAPNTSTSDPRTQQQLDADKATAQNAVLKLADFPTGWTGTPATDTADEDLQQQMSACIGSDLAKKSPTRVESDDFADPDDTMTASNSVSVLPSVDANNAAMDTFMNAKVPGCLSQAMDSAISKNLASSDTTLPKGTTIGKAEAATESFPNVADRTAAYRVTVPVQANGVTLKISADFVAFTKGRAGATLALQGQGLPFPSDLATSLAQTVAGRLPAT